VLLRWDFRPGSSLLAVYTRAQAGDAVLRAEAPRLRLGGLDGASAEDRALLKLSFFLD